VSITVHLPILFDLDDIVFVQLNPTILHYPSLAALALQLGKPPNSSIDLSFG
jgi:hypothetical protein